MPKITIKYTEDELNYLNYPYLCKKKMSIWENL